MNIISGLLVVLVIPFWAAVLAFSPVMVYLMLNPLYSIRAEEAVSKNIYLLREEIQLKKERKKRLKGVTVIYLFCLWAIATVCFINWIQKGQLGIKPFDMFSVASVLLFGFAVITYLPFAAYLMIKEPWKYKEEGAIFTKIFIVYGLLILFFSFVYCVHWLKIHRIFFGVGDFLKSFFILFFSSVSLSYLPVLIYVFFNIKDPHRAKKVRLPVVFIIYCVCFFLFSAVYIMNWYANRSMVHSRETISSQAQTTDTGPKTADPERRDKTFLRRNEAHQRP